MPPEIVGITGVSEELSMSYGEQNDVFWGGKVSKSR